MILALGKNSWARSAICGLLRLATVCFSWFRSSSDLMPDDLATIIRNAGVDDGSGEGDARIARSG